LESTLSGHAQAAILKEAKGAGYKVEIHYLWLPSPALAVRRVAQRVKKGGHHIPTEDIHRRYRRSVVNFVRIYAPLADYWAVWENTREPVRLLLSSRRASLAALEELLLQ
jgi:predicted ABC-type ATPase